MARRRRARSARFTAAKRKLGAVAAEKLVPRVGTGCWPAYHSVFIGILVFIIGLLLHYEWKWSAILMLVGVIVFIKGLIVAATSK